MRIPAGKTRRTRIQWHDDGSAQRAHNVAFEDGSPYKALALAAVLGVVSIVAVVSVIQFQRQGGFDGVATSLVEEARASPEIQPTAAPSPLPDETPKAAAGVAPPPAQPAPLVEKQAADLQLESARSMVRAVSAQLAAPEPDAALAQVEAIAADEQQRQALAPLTTNDPRWQAVETASIASPAPVAEPDVKSADAPLAFAASETPAATPRPEPAPRKKAVIIAAVDPEPQPVAENAVQLANAKVRSSVFLRSRPADGSKVLVTIPGGAGIQVASGCRHWCAVTYQGKSGFIYKSFLAR